MLNRKVFVAGIILLLGFFASFGFSMGNEWAHIGENAQRTGQSEYYTSNNTGEIVWKYFPGGYHLNYFKMGNEILIVFGDWRKNRIAEVINSDGVILKSNQRPEYWEEYIVGSAGKSLFVKSAFIDSNNRTWHELHRWDLESNAFPFEFSTDKPISNFSLTYKDRLYIMVGDELYAININNDSVEWKVLLDDGVIMPSAYNDTLILPSKKGNIYSVGLDGKIKWKKKIPYNITSYASISNDGIIYFGTYNGYVYAMDMDGNIKWTGSRADEEVQSISISDNGDIYVSAIAHGTEKKRPIRFYTFGKDGKIKWSFVNIGNWSRAPIAVIGKEGTVYIGFNNDYYAIYPNGSIKWKLEKENMSFVGYAAIGKNGSIYVRCDKTEYNETENKTYKTPYICKIGEEGEDYLVELTDERYYQREIVVNKDMNGQRIKPENKTAGTSDLLEDKSEGKREDSVLFVLAVMILVVGIVYLIRNKFLK